MEFFIVILIVAIAGGVLGYFAGKKYKAETNRRTKAVLLSVILALAVYAAFTVSKVYFACVVLVAGDLIGMAIPKKKA